MMIRLRRRDVLIGALGALWAPGLLAQDVSGYVRSIFSARDLGYAVPPADQRGASAGLLARLKLGYRASETLRFDVHSRVQGVYTSSVSGEGTVGFGVSTVPERTVQLRSILADGTHVQVLHDLDRASFTWLTSAADITVGRQAITWGQSNVFPVGDLWAQFSPFELDTEEKRGIDAVRVLMYPDAGVELDVVIADRGSARDLSYGVRATTSLGNADVYMAGGKFWRQAIGLAGAAIVMDVWKFRGEVAVPYELDQQSFQRVRATLGVDRVGMERQWSVEYHFNGVGASDPNEYATVLTSASLRRGESYYIGRHYLGGFGAVQLGNDVSAAFSVLANVVDPSAALFPSVVYQPGNVSRITAGILWSGGDAPVTGPGRFVPRSEFGLYGRHLFVTASWFY